MTKFTLNGKTPIRVIQYELEVDGNIALTLTEVDTVVTATATLQGEVKTFINVDEYRLLFDLFEDRYLDYLGATTPTTPASK